MAYERNMNIYDNYQIEINLLEINLLEFARRICINFNFFLLYVKYYIFELIAPYN